MTSLSEIKAQLPTLSDKELVIAMEEYPTNCCAILYAAEMMKRFIIFKQHIREYNVQVKSIYSIDPKTLFEEPINDNG